jgi:hypothetical protein
MTAIDVTNLTPRGVPTLFGERGMLFNEPRAASVRAIERCELLKINRGGRLYSRRIQLTHSACERAEDLNPGPRGTPPKAPGDPTLEPMK